MKIRTYNPETDFEGIISLMKAEGEEWSCYCSKENAEKYKLALAGSITYVAIEHNIIIGFSRSFKDFDFYMYISDLLVHKEFRGRDIGKELIGKVCDDFPNNTIFVMSDVDEYYKKLGFRYEGSIFEVTK